MKKFAGTIIAVILFAGLLVWVATRERGRVAEKEEIFRGEIARAEDIVKLEIAKYEYASVSDSEASNAEADESDNAEGPPHAPAASNKEAKTKQRVTTTRLVIEKRDNEWYLSEPIQGLVDPDTAKNLLKAIVELKPGVRTDVDPNSAEFGLDKPTFDVTAYLKNGKQIKITLGADTPVGAKVFAKISDKQGLFIVPSTFKTDVDKKPEAIRDKKLARFDKDQVARVTFITEKGTVVAEKKGKQKDKNVWEIVEPGQYKADEWAITSGINKITDSEAKEFAENPNDLKLYGLDKPRVQCKIELTDGKVYEILLGSQIKKKVKPYEYSTTEEEKSLVYAMRKGRPEVLLVEDTLFTDLNKDLMALRDKHILAFKRDDVMSLRVDRSKGLSFYVMRTGDGWTIQTPETAKAKKTKVDDILWDLTDLEAKEYLSGAQDMRAIGLAVPSTVITLKLKGGKSVTVKFGDQVKAGTETQYYCQTSDSNQIYKVGELVVKDLPEKIEDLKEESTSISTPATNATSAAD